MKKLLATAALAATLICGPAHAEKLALMGAGTGSCTDFANAYSRAPHDAEDVFFSWAQGYMSAMNLARIVEKKSPANLNVMSTETQQAFIRDYCNSHPLAQYGQAVQDLLSKLFAQSK